MLLGPRVLDGTNGFHLITPLVRGNGSTILVDRGFISGDTAARRSYPTPDEEVEVRGMLRESQARNSFTPDNNAAKGEWYWADVTAMADYAGGESSNVQSVLVEEIFGECLSQPYSSDFNPAQRVMEETLLCACPTEFR
jgi:surfeit locus 1 family protein